MAQFPDLEDGGVLQEINTFKFIAADVAGTSTATGETELATVQVPANAVGNGILILADISTTTAGAGSDTNDGDFNLRIGTDGTVLNNASKRTMFLKSIAGDVRLGASIMHYDTTLTKSSLNYVSISGAATGLNDTVKCDQLIVFGF